MPSIPPALPRQDTFHTHTLALAARTVSAYVVHNPVRCAELPRLIHEVCQALVRVSASSAAMPGHTPAVPINHSVFLGYIICLDDGLRFKTLRRHLMAAFGLTPEQYRRRWGLAPDYPMVAPN